MPNGEQPVTSDADSNDACENEADYIITRDGLNEVNDAAQRQNERINDDVSNRNEATEAEKNENFDWPDSAVYPKNKEQSLPDLSERRKNDALFSEQNSPNEIDAQDSPKWGDDIIVPEISQSVDRSENLSPRGGRYNLRPNPNPNYSEDLRY